MVETLGRSIKHAQNLTKIQGISVADNIDNTTHQQFADDTILVGLNTRNEAKKYKIVIDKYTKASTQMINTEKSKFFFLNTPKEEEDYIYNLLGYKKRIFSCKYLGIFLDKDVK